MSLTLNDIATKIFIQALFVRDDDQRFLLGGGEYEFDSDAQHFVGNTIVNDVMEVQGGDGALLAGQVQRAGDQTFTGRVGTLTQTKSEVEALRMALLAFFRPNHFYKVVYILPSGMAIKRERGYLTQAVEVMEAYQISPTYSLAMNFEDVAYYCYTEDDDGNDTSGGNKVFTIVPYTTGGLVWDENGIVWDENGATWEEREEINNIVVNNSIYTVLITWTVTGKAVNPTITNTTNGSSLQYNGTVASGSTLVVDCLNQTALLDGVSVLDDIEGDWFTLEPGENEIEVEPNSTASGWTMEITWNEEVG